MVICVIKVQIEFEEIVEKLKRIRKLPWATEWDLDSLGEEVLPVEGIAW